MTWKAKVAKFLAIIGSIVVVLALGLWYLDKNFSGPGLLGCGGEIYSSSTSPDKQLTAYSFERDCGATTGFSTFVIIRATKDKLDLSSSLVESEIVFLADGDYHPQVKWLSNDQLSIAFDPTDAPQTREIWQQEVVHDQIRINYRGLPS